MSQPHVYGIWISPVAGAEMEPLDRAVLVAGRGIVGDRYHEAKGSFSRWPGSGRAVTFIAAESIRSVLDEYGIDLGAGRSRRNIVTGDADLGGLLGRRFRIGTALMRGSRACQPCKYLERLIGHGTFQALQHRGGIRADILESGTISIGDEIQPVGPQNHLP